MGTLQLDPAHPPAPPPHRHAHSKPDTPPAANKISNNKLVNRPAAATFDEISMERSKSFVKALQELKSLRPQLYSAADYCEKSYLHNEQKQMVLDNLKEYAVRALVNAVDHLGTVAYKLTDLFEQEATDVSNVESKISCLNQEFATCQTYMDIEGLRQQRLFATTPRHHKHYILPGGHNKKVRISPRVNVHVGENHVLSRPHPNSEGTPASKTLSWHLASETNSTTSETPDSLAMCDDSKATKTHPEPVSLRDAVDASKLMPLAAHLQSSDGGSQLTTGNKYGSKLQASMEDSKLLSTFQSLHDDPCRREACRPVSRNKSILSAFFAKNKYTKQKRAYVS